MYSLTKSLTSKRAAWIEFTSFAVSLAVAQTWFKFGSFAVELAAFLALWWGLSGGIHGLTKLRSERTQYP